jgi:hypothetical protein
MGLFVEDPCMGYLRTSAGIGYIPSGCTSRVIHTPMITVSADAPSVATVSSSMGSQLTLANGPPTAGASGPVGLISGPTAPSGGSGVLIPPVRTPGPKQTTGILGDLMVGRSPRQNFCGIGSELRSEVLGSQDVEANQQRDEVCRAHDRCYEEVGVDGFQNLLGRVK